MVLRVRISHPTFRDEEEVWIVFQFQRHQKEDSTKMRWKPWKASTKKHQMLKKAQKLMVILVLGRDEVLVEEVEVDEGLHQAELKEILIKLMRKARRELNETIENEDRAPVGRKKHQGANGGAIMYHKQKYTGPKILLIEDRHAGNPKQRKT